MTISTTVNKAYFSGNGSQTVFPYSFLIPDASELQVIYTDTTGAQFTISSSLYTATGIGSTTGGTVTYNPNGTPIASGTRLAIVRILPLNQETTLANQAGYLPQAVESALDTLEMQIQQVNESAQRTLQAPIGDPTAILQIPTLIARANQYLAFDANGLPIASSGTGADSGLRSDLSNSAEGSGIDLVVNGVKKVDSIAALQLLTNLTTQEIVYVRGFYGPGTPGGGAFSRLLSPVTENGITIFNDASGNSWQRIGATRLDCFMAGAKGDGITDDSSSFTVAATYCASISSALHVPPPTLQYLIGSTVSIACSLIGDMPETVAGTKAGQFLCTSNINAFAVAGSRITLENIGVQYTLGAQATSSAVGFLFGNSTTQFSRSIVRNCFVRNAYDSFKSNSAGTGTLWGVTFDKCNSDLHVNRPFNFNCVNGSTTCNFSNCYGIGDTSSGNKPEGAYLNNITEITGDVFAIDSVYDDAFSVNNGNAIFQEIRLEGPQLSVANSGLINTAACHLTVNQINIQSLTINIVGNGGIVKPATGSYITKVGTMNIQFTTTTSGTLYKYLIGTLGNNPALVIDDPLCAYGDIFYNGYDSYIQLNGQVSITSTASLIGTWPAGKFVWNRTPSEAGSAASKYIVTGWNRVTTGSGNVVNTDWFAARTLTGN